MEYMIYLSLDLSLTFQKIIKLDGSIGWTAN